MSDSGFTHGAQEAPANPVESLRKQRHFIALVLVVAVARFVLPPGRVPGAAETWQTVGVLWLLGIAWVVVRAPRGRLVGDSVGDVGAQNLAIQALIVLPSVIVGVVRMMGGEAAGAFPANVAVTVVFLPLASLVILTLGALPLLWVGLRVRGLLGLGVLLLAMAPAVTAQECAAATELELDHVVLAVPDLAAAADFFRDELGFTLKPGRPHDNSISNMHAKFRDGTEVELLTATEPLDALAEQYLDFLRGGAGFAYVAFRGPDLAAAAARIDQADFVSNRAFDWLAFPHAHRWHHMFLIDLHHPPNDPPAVVEHSNTAVSLSAVTFAATDPEPERAFLRAFGACPSDTGGAALRRGAVNLVTSGRPGGRRIASVTVQVEDLTLVKDRVSALGGRPFQAARGAGVTLTHDLLGSAELRFEEIAR